MAAGPSYVQELAIPGNDLTRGRSLEVPWVDDENKIRDYAHSELMKGRYPREEIDLVFKWENDAVAAEMLGLEYGQLKYYKDTALGAKGSYADEYYRVVSWQHNFTIGGLPFTTMRLRPAHLYHNIDKLIWDDFNRADSTDSLGTSPTGDTWIATKFDIVGNKASIDDSADATFDLGNKDLKMLVQISGMVAGAVGGLIYRRGASASNEWLVLLDYTNSQVLIRKVVAGVGTTVDTATWTPGATAEMRVIVQGNRHQVWVDRKLIKWTTANASYITDSALSTNTVIGIDGNDGATPLAFDNFSAIGLSA